MMARAYALAIIPVLHPERCSKSRIPIVYTAPRYMPKPVTYAKTHCFQWVFSYFVEPRGIEQYNRKPLETLVFREHAQNVPP